MSTALRPVDVSTFIGPYPFRHLPHPDPEILVRVLAREEIGSAWVGHLPTAFHREPSAGNTALYAALAPHAPTLLPVPAVRPDWPGWERELARAVEAGAPAIRAYPPQWGLAPGDRDLAALGDACAEHALVLLLTVRFEDLRQRSRLDVAGDVQAAAVRELVRGSRAAVVVTAAGREFIEEVHWGLTPAERARVWWDFAWVWGPPDDHLARLFRSIGADRFVYGTQWPLRLTQAPAANLALLPDDVRHAALADPRTLVMRAREALRTG
jgi:predicted TIM-barrel fold metal-dependent hydrolase